MIVGHHVIVGAYGFWLPNDPRGSWSEWVGSWELFCYGPANKTMERRSLAGRNHDHELRIAAKRALKRPAVVFTGQQARAVAEGFGEYARKSGLRIWACAILSEHIHLVIGQTDMHIKQAVIQLKGAATESLVEQGLHPFGHLKDNKGRTPKCFARGLWKVFLNPDDVPRAIRYVEDNPRKEGKKRQRWTFVTPPNYS
ncbi:MAG: hypothetical protein FJ271_28955 [Planctomycetes bacterium]|nr:hypothetical protein [Planctomycetota bacterium]